MNEDQIREALGRGVTEPPPAPRLLARVNSEIHHRQRRRTTWMTAGGVACAVIVAVGLSQLFPGGGTTQTAGHSRTRSCTAAELSVKWDAPVGVQLGSELAWVSLRNTSSAACRLRTPTPTDLEGGNAGRGYRPIPTALMTNAESASSAGLAPGTVLQPGDPAGFVLNIPEPGGCSSSTATTSYTRLRFSLKTGKPLSVTIAAPDHLVVACTPISVSAIGVRTEPCTSVQIAIHLRTVSEETGEHAFYLRFTNRSDTACTLNGRPLVTFVDATGKTLPLRRTIKSQYFPDRPARTMLLTPQGHAYAEVAKYRCDIGIADTAATVRVLLPAAHQAHSLSLAHASSMDYCRGGRDDPGRTYAVSTFGAISTLKP